MTISGDFIEGDVYLLVSDFGISQRCKYAHNLRRRTQFVIQFEMNIELTEIHEQEKAKNSRVLPGSQLLCR